MQERKNEVVSAFGDGSQLWRVDVVLHRDRATDDQVAAIFESMGSALQVVPTLPDEAALADLEPTYSYDIEPPHGSIGVSCWVRADTLGQAAQVGHDVVVQAARTVTGRTHGLWDLRLLPRAAITSRADSTEAHGGFISRLEDDA